MTNGGSSNGPSLPSIAAAATALIAGVGGLTLTGALGRVQRNNGTWFAIALALVVVGAGIWVAATLIKPEARPVLIRTRSFGVRQLVQALGIVVSLIGLTVGFGTAVDAANDTEQAAVEVKVDPRSLVLTGAASVANLNSQEHLTVFVDGLVDRRTRYVATNLYKAFIGPNEDGKASQQLDVQVPHGRFDAVGVRAYTSEAPQSCGSYPKGGPGDRKDFTGCVVLRLPSRLAHPQLTASWSGKPELGQALKLALTVPEATAGITGGVPFGLLVVGLRGDRKVRLYHAILTPRADRPTERELELPIDSGLRLVCAQATLEKPDARPADMACPIREVRRAVATVELRVPPG